MSFAPMGQAKRPAAGPSSRAAGQQQARIVSAQAKAEHTGMARAWSEATGFGPTKRWIMSRLPSVSAPGPITTR